jgi:hypothetical protein
MVLVRWAFLHEMALMDEIVVLIMTRDTKKNVEQRRNRQLNSGGNTCALVLVRWAFLHELASIHAFCDGPGHA